MRIRFDPSQLFELTNIYKKLIPANFARESISLLSEQEFTIVSNTGSYEDYGPKLLHGIRRYEN